MDCHRPIVIAGLAVANAVTLVAHIILLLLIVPSHGVLGAAVATSLGYGPRFLHSTGQLHKGGPNSGVFLQVTAKCGDDLDIPGQRYSFRTLSTAQAQGDFSVLIERGRRAVWAELDDVDSGLPRLREIIEACT